MSRTPIRPYREYQYPPDGRYDFHSTPGSSIVRSRLGEEQRDSPCMCVKPGQCGMCGHRVPDITASPMFRPFDDARSDPHGDTRSDTRNSMPAISAPTANRDEYEIEIMKKTRENSDMYRSKFVEFSSFTSNGHTYYRLKHKDEYAIKMTNNTCEHVNALLKIDSDTMGKWRISPYSSVEVDRPVHNSRRFVFVEESSDEAREGSVRQGINSGANGLVEVTFIPMIDMRPSYSNAVEDDSDSLGINVQTNHRRLESQYAMDTTTQSMSANFSSSNSSDYGAGATVLGDDSKQKFGNASKHFDEDRSRQVIRRVRIVVDKRKNFASIRDRDHGREVMHQDPIPPKLGFDHLYG